jgi:hypothetical protein
MPRRELSDAKRCQTIGFIKRAGITHRWVCENLNCIKIDKSTGNFDIAFAIMSLDILRFKNKNFDICLDSSERMRCLKNYHRFK